MMGTRETLAGGIEWDYLTRGRHIHVHPHAGAAARVKAKFWRRVRKQHKKELVSAIGEDAEPVC